MRTLTIALIAACILAATASAAHIVGNSADNVLNGTTSADLIEGRGGNDTIKGKAGRDDIRCGDGHDLCWGDTGNDTVTGGDGADAIYGGCNGGCSAGSNVLYGGPGQDLIGADNGWWGELIVCGSGTDTAFVDLQDEWIGCERVVIDGEGFTARQTTTGAVDS